jgi:hypothetical protein
MNRDEVYDLIMGVAVVTIGYMLWKQHKATATPAAAPTAPYTPTTSSTGDWREDWLATLTLGAL